MNIFDFSGQIFLKEFSEFSVEEEGDEEVIYYVTFCGVANNLHQIIKFLANTSSGHYLSEEKVLLHDFLMYVWGADLKKSIKTYFRPQRTRWCSAVVVAAAELVVRSTILGILEKNRVISWHVSVQPCILEDLDNLKWQVLSLFVSHAKEHAENWTTSNKIQTTTTPMILCLPSKSFTCLNINDIFEETWVLSMF